MPGLAKIVVNGALCTVHIQILVEKFLCRAGNRFKKGRGKIKEKYNDRTEEDNESSLGSLLSLSQIPTK